MIKAKRTITDKGAIVEEINDKINSKLMKSGTVEPTEVDKDYNPNDPESVKKEKERKEKEINKMLEPVNKTGETTVVKDQKVINPAEYKESLKFKSRTELTPFLLKLKEENIKRRIIPLHEDAEGYKFEVKFERPLKEADKPAPESIEDCQKWIDYDMKHYGKISDNTNNIIKKAGFQIIKDDHGDYEVTAGKYEELKEAEGDLKPEDRLKHLKDLYDMEPGDLTDAELKELKDAGMLDESCKEGFNEDELNYHKKSLEDLIKKLEGLTDDEAREGLKMAIAYHQEKIDNYERELIDKKNESIEEEKVCPKCGKKPCACESKVYFGPRKKVKESLRHKDWDNLEDDIKETTKKPIKESVTTTKSLKGTMWDFGDEE